MCLTCGCKQPNERHGSDRDAEARITLDDFKRAANADGQSMKKTLRNLVDTLREEAGVDA